MRFGAELQFTALKINVYNIHINARVLTHTLAHPAWVNNTYEINNMEKSKEEEVKNKK